MTYSSTNYKTATKKGFTLIEVLVTSMIAAIALSGGGMYLIISAEILSRGMDESKVQTNLRLIINRIADDVRGATELSNTDNSLVITNKDLSNITYTADSGKLLRNGNKIVIIGADSSNISVYFDSYRTGKYFSLDYNLSLSVYNKKGKAFSSESLFASINCRNLYLKN